jgi:hypothetical protein
MIYRKCLVYFLNGGTDTKAHRTPVPVWPNVRQKKKVFANSVQEGQSSVYDTKNTECTTLVSKVQSIKLFAPCGTLKVQREQ